MTYRFRRHTKGFTIIELLICVFIIGILSTIIALSYITVQQNANNSRIKALVDSWTDVIKVYQAKNAYLPNDWTCLGNDVSDFPSQTTPSEGAGVCERNVVVTYTGSDWSSEFKTSATPGQTFSTPNLLRANTNLPTGTLPTYTTPATSNGELQPFVRGIIYAVISSPSLAPNNQPGAYILYVLQGQSCQASDVYKTSGNLTVCARELTDPASWSTQIYTPS